MRTIEYVLSLPRLCVREVKYAYQRVRYGVSDRDTWSLDAYVGKVIARGMQHMDDQGVIDRSEYQDDWNLVKFYFNAKSRQWEPDAEEVVAVLHDEAMRAFGDIYGRMWW